jgi:hypothetical protein
MLNRTQGRRFLPYTLLIVTLFSVIPYAKTPDNVLSLINNTTLWWLILAYIVATFWKVKSKSTLRTDFKYFDVVNYYLSWNVFQIIRGTFVAETYWDWKGLLTNAFALLMPLVVFGGTEKALLQDMLRKYFKIALPLFPFFILLIMTDAYGFYLVPISFLILFFPLLSSRWKLLVVFSTLFVVLSNLGARSNVVKFFVPFLLLSIYYVRSWISLRLLEFIRIILIITPFFFFVLGVTGVFNVFAISSYLEGSYVEKKIDVNGDENSDDLTVDTRTFLYVEVLQTAAKYNTWVFGRSPARGNETEWFADLAEITGRKERLGNEVAILNIFTWTGLVGVFLYLVVFYRASYLSVMKSNNIYSKMLGIYIAFRWAYAWVEDINNFSLTNMFLWLTLGICLSTTFRNMSDADFKTWISDIFKRRHVHS